MTEIETTFCGLQNWFKAKFEKLGWMILAHAYGHEDKVFAYKNSLKRLSVAIKNRMKIVVDEDRKVDLIVLLKNVKILRSHVDKCLN